MPAHASPPAQADGNRPLAAKTVATTTAKVAATIRGASATPLSARAAPNRLETATATMPGGDPAHKQLLRERDPGAGRRDEHDQGPDHEQHEGHESHRPEVERADGLHVKGRRQQEKQSRDEQDRDRLLEPPHLGEAGDP